MKINNKLFPEANSNEVLQIRVTAGDRAAAATALKRKSVLNAAERNVLTLVFVNVKYNHISEKNN
jgi:hypothetical protein